MLRSWLRQITRVCRRQRRARSALPLRFIPRFESLSERIAPAVHAFVSAPGVLTVAGDQHNNTIVVSRKPSGVMLVNGAPVHTWGGVLRVGQISRIVVNGGRGNDTIVLDSANGKLPKAT